MSNWCHDTYLAGAFPVTIVPNQSNKNCVSSVRKCCGMSSIARFESATICLSMFHCLCVKRAIRLRKFRFRLRLNGSHSNRHKQSMYRLSQAVILSVNFHNLSPKLSKFAMEDCPLPVLLLRLHDHCLERPTLQTLVFGVISHVWSDFDYLFHQRFCMFKLSCQPFPQVGVFSLRINFPICFS